MSGFKYNRWLIGFIIIGLISALVVGWQRHIVEENNSVVEMVLDYEDAVELSQLEGVPLDKVLTELKTAGITSLAVYETSLKKLNESGKVSTVSGAALLQSYNSGSLSDSSWRALVEQGLVKVEEIYVTGKDYNTLQEVKADLIRRLSLERVNSLNINGKEVLAVKANYEKAIKWNLGLSTEELNKVENAGFYIVARPSNYSKVQADDIEYVFGKMAGHNISTVIFSGEEVLGQPKLLNETALKFKAANYTLGMVEHPQQLQFLKQDGLLELAEKVDYLAARVYVIPKDEQRKMSIDDALERWLNTDQERNIRVNLMRSFEEAKTGMSLLETNLTYFKGVHDKLVENGFVVDRAGTYQYYFPNKLLLILMCLGVSAAGVLYLTLLKPFDPKYQYMIMFFVAAILAIPIVMGQGNFARSMAALAAANLFPVLAMTYQMDKWKASKIQSSLKKIMVLALSGIMITGALSFIGGFYVGALLGDIKYLLEVNMYRGVKVTFVLPLILVTFSYLVRFNLFDGEDYKGNAIAQIKKVLNYPIYVKSLVAFAFVALAGLIFVGRSGHTYGVPVPAAELKFRAFLEQLLYARPRSKELLIGHPAFMLAVMAFYRKWPNLLFYTLVIVATIGQGSLVETFAHIRTPIFMSFMRGLGGIILGAGIGLIALLGAHVLYNACSFIRKEQQR